MSGPNVSECWREISANPITGEARRQGRKWTQISLPRAKPARFCRRASNCSVTGLMIGHEPLTPLTPPRSCPSCCYFERQRVCPCTSCTQISCERDLSPASSPSPHYLPLRQHGLRCSAVPESRPAGRTRSRPQSPPQTRPGNVPTALKITIDMLRVSGCGRHVLLE